MSYFRCYLSDSY